jgi:hypothetical protein
MAGEAEGFDEPIFFANEETNDVVAVLSGAVYGPDPSLDSLRQAGYAVALNTVTGSYDEIAGMGRHNHENTVVVPGGWDVVAACLAMTPSTHRRRSCTCTSPAGPTRCSPIRGSSSAFG